MFYNGHGEMDRAATLTVLPQPGPVGHQLAYSRTDLVKQTKDKHNADTMNWFRHEHDSPYREKGLVRSREADNNAVKMFGKVEWYAHNDQTAKYSDKPPIPRLTLPVANQYLKRSHGSESWFAHEDPNQKYVPTIIRAPPRENEAPLPAASVIVPHWLVHAPDKNLPVPKPSPRVRFKFAHDLFLKSHGQVANVFQEEDNITIQIPRPPARVREDGKQVETQGRQGHMMINSLVPNLPENETKAISGGRRLFEKERGTVNILMQGYLDPPQLKKVRHLTGGPAPKGDTTGDLLQRYGALSPVQITPSGRKMPARPMMRDQGKQMKKVFNHTHLKD